MSAICYDGNEYLTIAAGDPYYADPFPDDTTGGVRHGGLTVIKVNQ